MTLIKSTQAEVTAIHERLNALYFKLDGTDFDAMAKNEAHALIEAKDYVSNASGCLREALTEFDFLARRSS